MTSLGSAAGRLRSAHLRMVAHAPLRVAFWPALFLHVDHLVEKQVGAGRERPGACAGVPAFALRAREPALAADHGDGSPEYGARALGGGGAGRLVPEHRAVIEAEVAVIRDGPGTLHVIGLRDEKGRCGRPV